MTDQSSSKTKDQRFDLGKFKARVHPKLQKSALGILRTRFQIWRLSIWGFAPAIVYVLNTLKRRKVHRIGRVKSPTILARFALDGVSFPFMFFKSSCLVVALKVLSSELWNINNHLVEHPSQGNKGIFKDRRKKKIKDILTVLFGAQQYHSSASIQKRYIMRRPALRPHVVIQNCRCKNIVIPSAAECVICSAHKTYQAFQTFFLCRMHHVDYS